VFDGTALEMPERIRGRGLADKNGGGDMKRILAVMLMLLILEPSAAVFAGQGKDAAMPDETKSKVETALKNLQAELQNQIPEDEGEIAEALKNYLGKYPQIYGAAFAYAPVEKAGKASYKAFYIYRKGKEGLVRKDMEPGRDFTQDEWYAVGAQRREGGWSKPYYDTFGAGPDVLMTTYSLPVFETGGRLLGVVTSDVLIQDKEPS
jgi:hypothetical protein